MSRYVDMDWDNIAVDEIFVEEGHVGSSSDSESIEEGESTDENSSFAGDDLNYSDFEENDLLIDGNIENEIELVGERVESHQPMRMIVGVHVKECGSQSSSKTEKGKSLEVQVYDGNASNSDFEFDVGLCFNTPDDFRTAVRMYATKHGKPLKFTKNCSDKIQVTCDCGWVMFASSMSKNEKTFQVKTIKGDHNCYRVVNSLHCNSKYLANKYEHNIRSNPEWPVNSMQEIMQRDNKTSLSVWKMYRAKKHVSILSSGTKLEQYAKL
ncbi:hypothetical protein KSP39_PZI010837 [Platanthera zijinensis]|uniref:Transposase MuDR plant domain-containing protein n=1 Tax=Platanthera zijinensis TaxID=2320716 RepID=A0AAP0G675_9ASPA